MMIMSKNLQWNLKIKMRHQILSIIILAALPLLKAIIEADIGVTGGMLVVDM